MSRPPLSTLLADPANVVLRTDLLGAGWPERLVDALFQRAGRREPGYSRPFVFALDVATDTTIDESSDELLARRANKSTTTSTPPATLPHGVPGSAYIIARGEGPQRRFIVRFKLGGREAKIEHAGSFRRKSEAVLRRNLIAGMLAAGLGKEIRKRLRAGVDDAPATVTEAGKRWLGSRIDISVNTVRIHGDSLKRLESLIGDVPIEDLTADDVATAIATLADTCKPSTVRKSLNVLQQALDHAQLEPNVARDRRIRLPRQSRAQIAPPETAHVEEVVRALPARYRLPVLALDSTGMRISELCDMTWGDIDEHAGRWRVRADTAKTGIPRWIDPIDPDIHAAVCALTPREDRDLSAKVFPGLGDARLRVAITRACKATGTPHFSPHDLRHRRISLLVLRGTPIPRVSAYVGHARGSMTLDVYSHVLIEATEVDYAGHLQRT